MLFNYIYNFNLFILAIISALFFRRPFNYTTLVTFFFIHNTSITRYIIFTNNLLNLLKNIFLFKLLVIFANLRTHLALLLSFTFRFSLNIFIAIITALISYIFRLKATIFFTYC
jgi:hypothetical protein